MFRSSDFPAQFPLKHMSKDLELVMAASAETGATVPIAQAATRLYREALKQNLGEMDFAAVKLVLERPAGFKKC
ncbi:MAG: NAD-binding protein [Desulfobacterales bacterium]|nr:NAD-binding protein [Desulfobacterales bacterium]